MLSLSRKVGEYLDVGNASIKVVRILGNRVILGIEAPKDVPVLRREVKDREEKAA